MRQILLLLTFIWGCITACAWQGAAAPTEVTVQTGSVLTLDDCLAIALDVNPTVIIADMEVTRQDYSKKETLGQLFPTINFGADYNRMLAKQVAYMNTDAFGGFGGMGGDEAGGDTPAKDTKASKKDTGIKMGLDNSFSVGFNAQLPLVAPQLWRSMKLSDAQILQTLEQARASRISLVNEVKTAYYTLLLAKDSKKVIQESYDMAALTHDIYTKQYAAGAASDYDVLRTSVAMKNIEPQLLQADIAIKQALLQLKVLMGIDVNAQFDIAGQLSDYQATMYDDVLSLSRDYQNNTELRANELNIQTLQRALDVQKAAWWPTIAAIANMNWTSSSNGNPLRNFRWTPYSVVGLSLSLPIFQGGQRYYRQKQAQIQVEQMQWQRENIQKNVATQVDLAIDNIQMNVKQIASTSESVNQADRAHTIMEKSFAIGSASYLDLRDSELALTQARLQYYQSIYNYLVARAGLELLKGDAPIDAYTRN